MGSIRRLGGRASVRQANPQIPSPPPPYDGALCNWELDLESPSDTTGPWRGSADVTLYVTYAALELADFDPQGSPEAPGAIELTMGGAEMLRSTQIVVPRVGLALHVAAPIAKVKAVNNFNALQAGQVFDLVAAAWPAQPSLRGETHSIQLSPAPSSTGWRRIPDFSASVQLRTIGGLMTIEYAGGDQTPLFGGGPVTFPADSTPMGIPSNAVWYRIANEEAGFAQQATVFFQGQS